MSPGLGVQHTPAEVGWEQEGKEDCVLLEGWRQDGLVSSFRFIYETEHHNGIAELLEILGR